MSKFLIVTVLCSVLFLQGCLVFAASQMGYLEAKSKYSKLYNEYKSDMEKLNIDNVNNKLEPQPIVGFNAWLIEQPLKHNEIKVFRNNGVISDEDARSIKQRQIMEIKERSEEQEK